MPLTPEETELYTSRLAEAETALHTLIMGKKAVQVNYDGEGVTFVRADEGRLRRYIDELRFKLGQICSARRKGISA